MEVDLKTSPEFDTAHPNYERWKRGRKIAVERAKFVKSVLTNFINCQNLRILDIGSGEGGTGKIFAENNFVVSIEKNPVRIMHRISKNPELLILGDALNLPIKEKTFDVIILQDSIEHMKIKKKFSENLYKLLKDKGIVYLSTPNKYSLFNIVSDPHWGLPVVSLLSRENIKKYFLRYFRKKDFLREDIAELYSLRELRKSFEKKFELILNTKFATRELFNGNRGLIWSNFHLQLLRAAQKIRLEKFLNHVTNDKEGILNRFFTPTFYLILMKK
jgi:SAM-dependent methyltransferase